MARQTRQQRRQRRAQQQPAVAGGPSPQQQPARPAPRAAEPREEREPRPERQRQAERRSPALIRFVQESAAELKKVEWPSQQAVVSGTAVVIIACLVVGTFLWANDELWKYVVQHILLR